MKRNGADPCPKEANPAEWMLEVVGAAPGSHAKQDYFDVWRNSNEYQVVKDEISRMEIELSKLSPLPLSSNGRDEKNPD